MRVSMSATGSVIVMIALPLPAGLADARDEPVERLLAETDATVAEFAQIGACTATPLAAVVLPHPELRLSLALLDHCLPGHRSLVVGEITWRGDAGVAPVGRSRSGESHGSAIAGRPALGFAERQSQLLQQRQRVVIAPGGRHERHVEAVHLLDHVVV